MFESVIDFQMLQICLQISYDGSGSGFQILVIHFVSVSHFNSAVSFIHTACTFSTVPHVLSIRSAVDAKMELERIENLGGDPMMARILGFGPIYVVSQGIYIVWQL